MAVGIAGERGAWDWLQRPLAVDWRALEALGSGTVFRPSVVGVILGVSGIRAFHWMVDLAVFGGFWWTLGDLCGTSAELVRRSPGV